MIGVAIVGAGMVADTHARALHDLKDVATVIGVHARQTDRLKAFCARHGLPPAPDLDRLLAEPGLDAVIVLTPPNARQEIVARAVAAGKHILMEKPVERTTAAAESIVDAVERAGLTLGIVFQHRFRAASLRLEEICRILPYGPLRAAQVTIPWWRPQSYYDVAGRGTYARDGGGVLISQAIHTLDLMQVFTGPVASVQAIAATTGLHRMESEDFVAGGLSFASGAVGSLLATTAHYPGDPESIVLDFDRASIRLQSGQLLILGHDGGEERFGEAASTGGGADPMAFTHDWHTSVLRDFFEAIREERAPKVTGRAALANHRLIDALLLSAREGRRVEL